MMESTRVAAHADDEGKAKALAIGGVQPLEACELRSAELIEPNTALLAAGLRRHAAGAGNPAGKLRVTTDEVELLGLTGRCHCLLHGSMQVGHGGERSCPMHALGDPKAMLDDVPQGGNKGVAIGRIQHFETMHGLCHVFGLGLSDV